MDVTKEIGVESRGRPKGIGWPLVGSAAWHLLVLASVLLWAGAAADRLPAGIAEVLLIDAGSPSFPAADAPPAASGKGSRRVAELRPLGVPVHPRVPPAELPARQVPAAPAVPAQRPVAAPSAPVEPAPPSADLAWRSRPAAGLPGGKESSSSAPVDSRGKAGGTSGAGPAQDGIPGNAVREGNPGKDGPPAGRSFPSLAPAAGGGDGGTVGEGPVRLLRERIESRIAYPEEAVRRGQEGMVVLRIRIGEGGIPKEVRVARSSGARILDEAARTGVVRASPLPSDPGWFEVPVRFLLR